MNVNGKPFRSIWLSNDGWSFTIIDQTRLPHTFATTSLRSVDDAASAIRNMLVRGAPLIGATAAAGICLTAKADPSGANLQAARGQLMATRPTAVNLRWALDEMQDALADLAESARQAAAYQRAAEICDADIAVNAAIGDHGSSIIRSLWEDKGKPDRINLLTHCNAGWLATVDWGTALAPVYKAHDAGIPIHVWVDETRPRNQGASLTAWELGQHGVPHTVIVDNAGGHLMQHGLVDLCIVGTDRTTATGDVCNKIGTYLKALAARDNGIPFYVALPTSTIDWTIRDGIREIPIEQRDATEVSQLTGRIVATRKVQPETAAGGDTLPADTTAAGGITTIDILPEGSPAANYAFDVTPARYITSLITEKGVVPASEEGLGKVKAREIAGG